MIWLLIYNWIRRPIYNRQILREWRKEDHGSAICPHLPPLTRADLGWARSVLIKSPFNL